jgi:hypothetical protein
MVPLIFSRRPRRSPAQRSCSCTASDSRWSTPHPSGLAGLPGVRALAATRGVVGVTVDHRLYDPADYPLAAADIATAVRTARADPRVDADLIAIWVFSGGGLLLADWLHRRPEWLRCVRPTGVRHARPHRRVPQGRRASYRHRAHHPDLTGPAPRAAAHFVAAERREVDAIGVIKGVKGGCGNFLRLRSDCLLRLPRIIYVCPGSSQNP